MAQFENSAENPEVVSKLKKELVDGLNNLLPIESQLTEDSDWETITEAARNIDEAGRDDTTSHLYDNREAA